MNLPEIQLAVRVHGRHPWFFRKMIRRPRQSLPAGAAVRVRDRDGAPVGIGFYNARCELALRILRRGTPDNGGDDIEACLQELLDDALELRHDVLDLPARTTAYRLVHAEGDGLPGLILDRLADTIVAQVFALGIHHHIEPIGEHLLQRLPDSKLVLTVDSEAAKREGIPAAPPVRAREVEVHEHGVLFAVRPGEGHKTGFFADQRGARQRVRSLAHGRRVLDLFCNAGGFAVCAALGGAREVLAADLDERVIAAATENAARNRTSVTIEHDDAFEVLRRVPRGHHDLIIVDPPKWATGKSQIEAARKRYADINRLAFEKAPTGGLLLTCSCSGALSEHGFLDILRRAAEQANRDARVLHVGGAGPDHPHALECPEGRYLKTVLLQVR